MRGGMRSGRNGKKSIEGIPAITAAIPTLMNTPYSTSKYSGNRISGIASLLGNLSYSSSFYHGGTNGTMGFDSFSKVAGFKKYYGRNEYNNNDGKRKHNCQTSELDPYGA